MSEGCRKSVSLEALEEHFIRKVTYVKTCLELRNIDSTVTCSAESIFDHVNYIGFLLNNVKALVERQRIELQQETELENRLGNRIAYMQSNLPPSANNVLDDISNQDKAVENRGKNKSAPQAAAQGGKKSRTVAKVEHLTDEEFNSISQYMRGRLTCPIVNKVIDEFNKAIECKYGMLRAPRQQLGDKALKVKKFKAQETDSTKGLFFCDHDDLKAFSLLKQDKTLTNSLIIMRHCNRIREIRTAGHVVKLAIVAE